jgi:acyl-CoA thioester hydrolase
MLEKVTQERIRVRYGETDQMGHAYYANYFYWFEQARGAWCRDRGFTYREMETGGHLLPVVEAHAEYKGEVHYDDWIVVKVWVSELRRASVRFEYEIVNESSGKLTTKGYTWHVLMGQHRKAITMPESVKELFHRDPDKYERLV